MKYTIPYSPLPGFEKTGILGRRDLFKKARITFEGYKNLFHIELRKLN